VKNKKDFEDIYKAFQKISKDKIDRKMQLIDSIKQKKKSDTDKMSKKQTYIKAQMIKKQRK
jgi:hypothetical protein